MLVGAQQHLGVAVAAETVPFGLEKSFKLGRVIDFPVVNQDVPGLLVAHGLMPKCRDVLYGQTAVSQGKDGLLHRNNQPTTIIRAAVELRIEHGSYRHLGLCYRYCTQNCRDAAHNLILTYESFSET